MPAFFYVEYPTLCSFSDLKTHEFVREIVTTSDLLLSWVCFSCYSM